MAADGLVATTQDSGIVRVLNCLPSQGMDQDWGIQNAIDTGMASALLAPPDRRDLRDDSWWSIGDQGSTGSCVGWALADSVLRWHFVSSGLLQPTDRLSPRFSWMAAKETDEFTSEPSTFIERAGTSLKAALEVARHYGAVADTVLPFGSGALFDGDVNTFYSIAAQAKLLAYFNLGGSAQDWRTWLASNGPILTRLSVDRTWDDASQVGGVLDVYRAATARGGHAVALVGYAPEHFIVRNSWGVNWGDNGYAYASLRYAEEAFTETYGVTVSPAAKTRPQVRKVWRR